MTQVLERGADALAAPLAGLRERLQQADGADPLLRLRAAAVARLDGGLPRPKDEAWRFTRLRPLLRHRFQAPEPARARALTVPELRLEVAPGTTRLVFVNGRLRGELSQVGRLPAGATLSPLADVPPARLAEHLDRHRERGAIGPARSPFVDLNTALFEDGLFLHLPRGARLEAPLLLVCVVAGGEGPVGVYPRNVVVLDEGAEASVVEVHLTPAGAAAATPTFTDAVSEVALGAGARLDWTQVHEPLSDGYHLGALQVHQGRDSWFQLHALHRGGPLVRADVHVVLDGEGAECDLRGLSLVRDGEQVDTHTWVDHAVPQARSQQVYKAVVDGRGEAVFDGQILVREGAQHTTAHQQSKNLLLSDRALVHTNPRLRILTDDVRCTHGATLGQLDREALFYLRSRGLTGASARALLTYAFVVDQLESVRSEPLRRWLRQQVREGLPEAALPAEEEGS